MSNNSPWKTLSSRRVYKGRWFSVRHDEVIRPDGAQGIYDVVEGRHFVLTIPKVDNKFCLVEQYRYPVQRRSIEFPMGAIEENENVEQALKRELQEESGLISNNFKKLGFLYLANGHNNIGFYVYVAENCQETERRLEASESDMITKKLTIEELKELIKNGTIKDGPTVAAFCLFLLN